MTDRREKPLSVHSPFWHFPFESDEEDFWGLGRWALDKPLPQTGLTVSEDESHVYVEANVPGLKPEEVEILFEKGALWVKGEKKEETEDKKKRYYRKASHTFSYRIQVPGLIDEKQEPEATYKDGVVRVRFSKAVESKPKKINIKKG